MATARSPAAGVCVTALMIMALTGVSARGVVDVSPIEPPGNLGEAAGRRGKASTVRRGTLNTRGSFQMGQFNAFQGNFEELDEERQREDAEELVETGESSSCARERAELRSIRSIVISDKPGAASGLQEGDISRLLSPEGPLGEGKKSSSFDVLTKACKKVTKHDELQAQLTASQLEVAKLKRRLGLKPGQSGKPSQIVEENDKLKAQVAKLKQEDLPPNKTGQETRRKTKETRRGYPGGPGFPFKTRFTPYELFRGWKLFCEQREMAKSKCKLDNTKTYVTDDPTPDGWWQKACEFPWFKLHKKFGPAQKQLESEASPGGDSTNTAVGGDGSEITEASLKAMFWKQWNPPGLGEGESLRGEAMRRRKVRMAKKKKKKGPTTVAQTAEQATGKAHKKGKKRSTLIGKMKATRNKAKKKANENAKLAKQARNTAKLALTTIDIDMEKFMQKTVTVGSKKLMASAVSKKCLAQAFNLWSEMVTKEDFRERGNCRFWYGFAVYFIQGGCFRSNDYIKLLPNQMKTLYDPHMAITFKLSYINYRFPRVEKAMVNGKMIGPMHQNLFMLAFKMIRCKNRAGDNNVRCVVSKKCYVSHIDLQYGKTLEAVWHAGQKTPPAFEWLLKHGQQLEKGEYRGTNLQQAGGVPCGAF